MENYNKIETILYIIVMYVVLLLSNQYNIASQPLTALTSAIIYVLIVRVLVLMGKDFFDID